MDCVCSKVLKTKNNEKIQNFADAVAHVKKGKYFDEFLFSSKMYCFMLQIKIFDKH